MNDEVHKKLEENETTYLGESRERIRRKLELLLEGIPEGIEKAESGDAEYAAVYLSAIEKIIVAILEEEAIAFERFVIRQD
ncbi:MULTISPECIES: hypothetical protein [Bhargavaea]|uniref:Uncharacterized protein n=1 Tax=Bhargavaea changchunensis TaxID=2134037 RepID=A0ABW2NIK6_9BACL|nr:hypothetical protein [Bhargavaea sp. CC-171006]